MYYANTGSVSKWHDPEVTAPPQAGKLLILTEWGVAILGPWRDNAGYVAWAPLPHIPKRIKEKMK